MQDYQTVTTELNENGVLKVMLNRPESRNALSHQLWEDIDAALCEAVTMDEVKVIILGGHGKAFSAGHDLKEGGYGGGTVHDIPGTHGGSVSAFQRSLRNHSFDMPMRWRSLPRPTIAMVQGPCFLNGFSVAQSMDIIIAADNAQFIVGMIPFLNWGWHLPARVAKELLFETRVIGPDEAKELGLINRVVPLARLHEETEAYAANVATKGVDVTAEAKRQINRMDEIRGLTTSLESSWQDYWHRRQTTLNPLDPTPSGLNRLAAVSQALSAYAAEKSPDAG